jgi:RimJ/RimL family protein N-acetyltransferase
VRAEARPGNEPSLRLLARLGFERVGERAGHVVLETAV